MGLHENKSGMDALARAGLALYPGVPEGASERSLKLQHRVTRLFDELSESVFRYVLCLGVNPTDVHDVVQETFLRLYRHLHEGGRDHNLRAWVFRVAHNISVNELRSHKYIDAGGSVHLTELQESDTHLGPEELILHKEKMARVHFAMSRLAPRQRECLYLRAEGFRYREVAEILGVSISTVAESVRRAIRTLAKEPYG